MNSVYENMCFDESNFENHGLQKRLIISSNQILSKNNFGVKKFREHFRHHFPASIFDDISRKTFVFLKHSCEAVYTINRIMKPMLYKFTWVIPTANIRNNTITWRYYKKKKRTVQEIFDSSDINFFIIVSSTSMLVYLIYPRYRINI